MKMIAKSVKDTSWAITICLFALATAAVAQQNGQSCRNRNGAPGTCKLIYDCAQAIRDLKAGLGRDLCQTGSVVEVVCCVEQSPARPRPPQSPAQSPPRPNLSRLRLADQKCHEYSELVYETVSVPSFIPGGQSTVKRVDKCGFKAIQLVVGGQAAAPKEFPHMALVGYGNPNSIHWGCGGAIVSRKFILTAGHCATTRFGPPTYVRTGDLIHDRSDDDSDPRTIRVARSIPHPSYQAPQQYNDIALIELADFIPFSQYARPACLNSAFNVPQSRAIVTGWGSTEWYGDRSSSLLKVTLDLFRFHECRPQFDVSRKLSRGLVEQQHVCAGSYTEQKDACEGDSGGPLQVYSSLHCMYNIIGVTSFGKACGTVVGIAGIYTRVSNYIDWIEQTAFVHG